MFTYKKVRDKWRVYAGDRIYKTADGKAHDGGGYTELLDCVTHIRGIATTKVERHEIHDNEGQKQSEIKHELTESGQHLHRQRKQGNSVQLRNNHQVGSNPRKRASGSTSRARNSQPASA